MERKPLRKLPDEALSISVMGQYTGWDGQDCLLDCNQFYEISGTTYYTSMFGCQVRECTGYWGKGPSVVSWT